MKRLLVVGLVAGLSWMGSPAQADENEDWVCVTVEPVMVTYCQGNPLPERLPLPEDRPTADEVWDCVDALAPPPQGESGGLPKVPDICE